LFKNLGKKAMMDDWADFFMFMLLLIAIYFIISFALSTDKTKEQKNIIENLETIEANDDLLQYLKSPVNTTENMTFGDMLSFFISDLNNDPDWIGFIDPGETGKIYIRKSHGEYIEPLRIDSLGASKEYLIRPQVRGTIIQTYDFFNSIYEKTTASWKLVFQLEEKKYELEGTRAGMCRRGDIVCKSAKKISTIILPYHHNNIHISLFKFETI